MPDEFGPWPTVCGRFRVWRNAGVITALLGGLIAEAATPGRGRRPPTPGRGRRPPSACSGACALEQRLRLGPRQRRSALEGRRPSGTRGPGRVTRFLLSGPWRREPALRGRRPSPRSWHPGGRPHHSSGSRSCATWAVRQVLSVGKPVADSSEPLGEIPEPTGGVKVLRGFRGLYECRVALGLVASVGSDELAAPGLRLDGGVELVEGALLGARWRAEPSEHSGTHARESWVSADDRLLTRGPVITNPQASVYALCANVPWPGRNAAPIMRGLGVLHLRWTPGARVGRLNGPGPGPGWAVWREETPTA